MAREFNHKLSECKILYFYFYFYLLSLNIFFYIIHMLISKISQNEMENLLFYLECHHYWRKILIGDTPQWGAADAEIKVPSGENTELKRSPFHAWSRSVYSHTCYAYCQGFLPCLFLPFLSIHLHFFQNLSRFFPVLACRIK